MSIFGDIWDSLTRVRGKKAPPKPAQPAPAPRPTPAPTRTSQPAPGAPRPTTASAAAPAQHPVDVEKILTDLANDKGGGGNWRTSIVDLLKLLDLDSSLAARKELAAELGVNAGAHGSAEQNMALSKAVWKKLAANGGKVPASLRD
jgi:hypothetical protein